LDLTEIERRKMKAKPKPSPSPAQLSRKGGKGAKEGERGRINYIRFCPLPFYDRGGLDYA